MTLKPQIDATNLYERRRAMANLPSSEDPTSHSDKPMGQKEPFAAQ
jgi:hypothetical protein